MYVPMIQILNQNNIMLTKKTLISRLLLFIGTLISLVPEIAFAAVNNHCEQPFFNDPVIFFIIGLFLSMGTILVLLFLNKIQPFS